jgi:opacity protein-like surface antigen
MGNLRVLALAGAAVIASLPAAHAADLPPIIAKAMPVVDDFGGWYLRGDIGMSNQRVKNLDNVLYSTADSVTSVSKGFDSAPIFGVGLGYQFNSWLRFDVTGEYRGKASFRGMDIYRTGATTAVDDYYGYKSEWVGLANVYFDLGTWYGVTPFVGAGIGFAYNTIHDFRDINVPTAGVAYAGDASKWNFAWAVHAGLAYKVTNAFTVELAYRYLNLGDAVSGDIIAYDGTNTVNNPMHFKNIDSHDVKLGVRWHFNTPAPAYLPLMTKG